MICYSFTEFKFRRNSKSINMLYNITDLKSERRIIMLVVCLAISVVLLVLTFVSAVRIDKLSRQRRISSNGKTLSNLLVLALGLGSIFVLFCI